MDIRDKLDFFRFYYNKSRASGHTYTMLEGARNNPEAIIISSNQIQSNMLKAQGIKNKIISINNLDQLLGLNKPIIFDNATLFELFNEALNKINKLENTKYYGELND